MKKRLTIKGEKFTYKLTISEKRIDLEAGPRNFFANYPFLNSDTGYLTDVPGNYYRLMMYILLSKLDVIGEAREACTLPDDPQPLISYSGGTDSTALLVATGGLPVHICRSFQPWYNSRQLRACKEAGALVLTTDFEQVREVFGYRHGFNIGIGYICMYIPLLPLLRKNTIALGTILEGIAFHYAMPFTFRDDFTGTNIMKVIAVMESYGIRITLPMAGYSEVLTVKIAESGEVKNYTSCHREGPGPACRVCFKCFRKEALRGYPLDFGNPDLQKVVLAHMRKAPLHVATSFIYAVQQAGYKHPELQRYMDIDVTFCRRVNQPITEQFGGVLAPGFAWQTEADRAAIDRFVAKINDPGLYAF
jgi:hypothetical protein